MQRTDRVRRARVALIGAGVLACVGSRVASAQGSVLLQGILDGEAWSTNASSNLLTRNVGRPAGLGRLQLWGAYEPLRHWVLYAQGEGEAGNARNSVETHDVYSDQFGIQYSPTQMFVVDAGRLTPLIGTFSSRRFSTRNPLIGMPDGYSLQYPLGVKVSGEMSHFDYRAAMVTLPADHLGYVPKATARLRPAIVRALRLSWARESARHLRQGRISISRLARRSSPERVGPHTSSVSLRSTRRFRAATSRHMLSMRVGATTCRDARVR
jgi:hypothetical protein